MAFWMASLSSGAAKRSDVLLAAALGEEHRAGALTRDGYLIGQESLAQERGWLSSSGDDRLEGGSGNDLLVGGDGFDTAVFAGARHDHRILFGADGTLRVADDIDRSVDTLSGIEAAEFADGTLDLGFLAKDPGLVGAAGLLYQAVLDRAGDAAGLAWWLGLGLSAGQMARAFTGSSEFQARFGAMDDAEFVRALYANSSLDASAAGGMAAWENYLQGHSRAELVAAWIAQDSVQAAHYGNQGIWLL